VHRAAKIICKLELKQDCTICEAAICFHPLCHFCRTLEELHWFDEWLCAAARNRKSVINTAAFCVYFGVDNTLTLTGERTVNSGTSQLLYDRIKSNSFDKNQSRSKQR